MDLITAILFIALGFSALREWLRYRHDNKNLLAWWRSERMPTELRRSRLYLNEAELSIDDPAPIHGRVDQVFMREDGVLVLVDTKTRSSTQAHYSDIYQLSAYAMMLRRSEPHPVAPFAYVRTVVGTGRYRNVNYIKVQLCEEEEVLKIWTIYRLISTGTIDAKCTCDGRWH